MNGWTFSPQSSQAKKKPPSICSFVFSSIISCDFWGDQSEKGYIFWYLAKCDENIL